MSLMGKAFGLSQRPNRTAVWTLRKGKPICTVVWIPSNGANFYIGRNFAQSTEMHSYEAQLCVYATL